MTQPTTKKGGGIGLQDEKTVIAIAIVEWVTGMFGHGWWQRHQRDPDASRSSSRPLEAARMIVVILL